MLASKAWNACRVDLQEVELVDRAMICGAAEEDEEHHGEATCDEDEGEEGEEGSWDTLVEVSGGWVFECNDLRPAIGGE